MINFAVNKPILPSFQLLINSDLQCAGTSFLRTYAYECYPSRHDPTGHNDLYCIRLSVRALIKNLSKNSYHSMLIFFNYLTFLICLNKYIKY